MPLLRGLTVERRKILRLSIGTLLASTLGGPFSSMRAANSPDEDAAASVRYNNERRFLETQYGRIAFMDRGMGDVVLFLHGFPLSGFQWRGAIGRLSPHRRCLAPDLMGLGYT